MNLSEKIKHYGLTKDDWFKHSHYTILTRMGIEKVQAIEEIRIKFEAVHVANDFCVIKAIGKKGELTIETYGSAKYGGKEWLTFDKPTAQGKTGKWIEHGNTTTWYVAEVAEKRAMSRVVLKITGFYELGVYGEDESEEFKKENTNKPSLIEPKEESVSPISDQELKVLEGKTIACVDLKSLLILYNSNIKYKTSEKAMSIITNRKEEIQNKHVR